MTELPRFRRGDVILVPAPFVTDPRQLKLRPAVVVQNDVANRTSPNLIIASISSQLPQRRYPTNFIVRYSSPDAEGTGLNRDSVVQTEIISTVAKADVVRCIGRFNRDAMRRIDRCLLVSLDLA